MSWFTRIFLAVPTFIVLLQLFLAIDFNHRFNSPTKTVNPPKLVVVFSGQYNRIEYARDLFEAGKVDRLFISGVNGPAGLDPKTLAKKFKFSPEMLASLNSELIAYGEDANNTLENAIETRCWMDKQPDRPREILLITTDRHMPRASLLLERSLGPSVKVHRAVTIDELSPSGENRLEEFFKFAGSWLYTLQPRRFWSDKAFDTCNE